jgi:hypothetical protein
MKTVCAIFLVLLMACASALAISIPKVSSFNWTQGATLVTLDSLSDIYGGQDAWSGPVDCSASISLGYDDLNLYYQVNVTDDHINSGLVVNFKVLDSVSLGLGNYTFNYIPASSSNQIILLPGSTIPQTILNQQATVTITGSGYIVEGSVPLLALGAFTKLDCVIRDSDSSSGGGVDTVLGLGTGSPSLNISTLEWQKAKLLQGPIPPPTVLSAQEIKTLQLGTRITTAGWVVTYADPLGRYCWVESMARDVAFRINYPAGMFAVQPGYFVRQVTGTFIVRDAMRQVDAETLTIDPGTFLISPTLFSNLRDLGGGPDSQLPFCGERRGVSSMGLLVKVSGRVTGSIPGGFMLDSTPVYFGSVPPINSFVLVTGVVTSRRGDSGHTAIEVVRVEQ